MTPNFTDFSKAAHKRFTEMQKHELFIVDVADIYATYLASFPAGTDPIYRERTHHDCNCCKHYLRRIGVLVNLINGKIVTVWDDWADLPFPYNEVAKRLRDVVLQAPIRTVFRTKERKYSTDHNYDGETNERYDHFHAEITGAHHSRQPDVERGKIDTQFQVTKRALKELNKSDVTTVLDLIASNSLYRGETYKAGLLGFQQLQNGWDGSDLYIWANLKNQAGQIRNTAIGSLLVDLADGKDLESAVKSFDVKVAPQNYKRTSALITPRMVEAAQAKIDELGLEGALHRRYATLRDISVANVYFVDNKTQTHMKGGVAALLGSTNMKPVTFDAKKATNINIEDFLKLPKKRLDLYLENRHTGNFVSLTTSDDPTPLFKWDNPAAWSYDGEVADSMKARVSAAGGRVDGPFRFTHSWNHEEWGRNQSLMDLHVFMPGNSHPADGVYDSYGVGRRVGWNHRNDHLSGGVQDVDHTAEAPAGFIPIENISFPSLAKMPEGKYICKVHNWAHRGITKSGFKAEIEVGGQLFQFEHREPLKHKQWVTVAEVTLKAGVFTVDPILPSTTSTREKWGVSTQQLVPVTIVCDSPNHWNGVVGAHHWFFMLDSCKNPDATRGIYNEFLRPELEQHRKVFEILGSKTKCPPTDDQVSGVGFTAARGDSVTVVVDGGRAYNVQF